MAAGGVDHGGGIRRRRGGDYRHGLILGAVDILAAVTAAMTVFVRNDVTA